MNARLSSAGRSPARVEVARSSTEHSRRRDPCVILTDRLVELHGQHEHQSLLDPLTHLPLLANPLGSRISPAGRDGVDCDARLRRAAGSGNGQSGKGRPAGTDRVPAWGDRKRRRQSPEKTRSSRHRSKCSRMPNEFNDSARNPTPSSTRATRPSLARTGPGLETGRRAGQQSSRSSPISWSTRMASSRSSRTWPSCCVAMLTKSTPPPCGCSRSRTDWRSIERLKRK